MKTLQFFRVTRFATLTVAVCMMCNMLYAQNVGINATGAAPNTSAGLDINFTNKGVLIPRVALTITTSNAPIGASVTTSLLVYNTATINDVTPGYYYWGGAAWVRFFTGSPLVDNGLYYNIGANRVRMGGLLVENTTVWQQGFQMKWNLNGTGDFSVQSAAIDKFQVRNDGLSFFGDDTYWRDGNVLGTTLARIYDVGNDGVLEVSLNGFAQHVIHGVGTTVFNEQGGSYDFRIESDLNANMFYVDASTNRVGIGTNIPTYQLDVVGNIGHNDLMYHNDDPDTYFRFPTLDQVRIYAGGVRMLDFVEGGTDYAVFNENSANVDFRIESDGQFDMFFVDASTNRIGLNTTTPQNVVDFRTTGENIWLTYWENNQAANGAVVQWNQTNTANGNRVAMGITNYSGNVWQSNGLIGLHINGAGIGQGVNGFSNSWDGTGTYGGFSGGTNFFATGWAVYADGWGGGLTAWQNVSDRRLKKDIITIDNALSKVMQLRGVQYKFSRENFPDVNFDTETPQLGFVAQEVEEVFPFLVREANITGSSSIKTTDMEDAVNVYKVKSMGYASIVPVLVEAIKEQQTIIEDLQKRIEELEK